MAIKVKISITVTQETVDRLEELTSELFPHISVSRGDVVDYLVAEKVNRPKRGTLMGVFVEEGEVKGE